MWHVCVQAGIDGVLTLFTLVVGLVALINCALQRSDAFPAIGTLQKPVWLVILGFATFLVLCSEVPALSADACTGSGAFVETGAGRVGFGLLFKLIALGASGLYLLDVRPGLRDISNGSGPW